MLLDYKISDVSQLTDPAVNPSILSRIPNWRKEKIFRFKLERDRKLSLGSWLLLDELFKKHGYLIDSVYIGEHGKLMSPEIFFNISHSESKVMAAVCRYPIGCDIEVVDKFPKAVISKVFSSKELKQIKKFPESKQNIKLYQLWTAKEAYLKMTGQGLINDLETVKIDLKNNRIYLKDQLVKSRLISHSNKDYCFSLCIDTNGR